LLPDFVAVLIVPADLAARYDSLLIGQDVPNALRPHFQKWVRFYWDFCHQYGFDPRDSQSLPAFDEKLRTKRQGDQERHQAKQAITLFFEALACRICAVIRTPGYATVQIDCGTTLLAGVSLRALAEMDLLEGDNAYSLIKAHAFLYVLEESEALDVPGTSNIAPAGRSDADQSEPVSSGAPQTKH
jgi:molybdopterin-binding protein